MQAQVVDISKVLCLFYSVQELLFRQLSGLPRPASQFPSEAECAERITLGWKAQKSPNAEAYAFPLTAGSGIPAAEMPSANSWAPHPH